MAVGPQQIVGGCRNSRRARVPRHCPDRRRSSGRAGGRRGPSASAEGAGCPTTSRLNRVSSSFSNRSSTAPAGRELQLEPREAIARARRIRTAIGPSIPTADFRGSGWRSAKSTPKGEPLDRLHCASRAAAILASDLRAKHAGHRAVRNHEPERPVRRAAAGVARPDRRSSSYESSSAGVCPARRDERELPAQVVRVLQAGVHPLRADRAVDVRGVAQQEASAVAEARGAAVRDAIGRKPGARRERQSGSGLVAYRWNHIVERHVVPVAQTLEAGCRRPASDPFRASGRTDESHRATGRR